MNNRPDKRKKRQRQNRSKPWLLAMMLGGGLLLVAAIATLALQGQKPPGDIPVQVRGEPNLVVDREHVDLGDIKLGEWVEVSFEVANNGDQPLRFQKEPYVSVVAGC